MAKYQKAKEEVESFLNDVKSIISNGKNIAINNVPWSGNKVNKTLAYMAETQITQKDIEKVIYELQLSNYSYTADDKNVNYKDEQVWIFGITKTIIDKDEDLYIKLKIRIFQEEMLLIMSFHPEKPEDTTILMKRKKKGAAKWKIEYAWNAEQKIHMNLEI